MVRLNEKENFGNQAEEHSLHIILVLFCYRPQQWLRKSNKVIFSQASVCPGCVCVCVCGPLGPRGGCTPPLPRWPLQRTVGILLECIFVFFHIKCFYRKLFKVQLQTVSAEIRIQSDLVELVNSTCVNWFQSSIIQWVLFKTFLLRSLCSAAISLFTAKVTPHKRS